MVDQSALWLQYLAQLNTVVALDSGEALHAIYPFESWDWGGKEPVVGSYAYEQWAALNVVPSMPYLNTNTSPASQSGFDSSYGIWMNTLAIGNLAEDAHYVQLQEEYADALNKQQQDVDNIRDVWKNKTGGVGEPLEKWLADPFNASYKSQLDEDEAAASAVDQQLVNYRNQRETPLQALLAAYDDPTHQANVTNPNNEEPVSLRIWSTDPPNPWAYVEQITGSKFGQGATAGNERSFTLTQSTSTYDYSKETAEGGGSVFDDFIGIEAGGSYSRVDWSQFDSEYSITMSFQDLSTIPVTADGWYQGAAIADFGKGPYATGFSAFAAGGGNFFFGVGGGLSRIYKAMIVAYRPKVVINAGSRFASYMQEKWSSEAGFLIGPFFFESEESGEKTSSTLSVEDATLTIESTADWPVIIGMKSAWTLAPQD